MLSKVRFNEIWLWGNATKALSLIIILFIDFSSFGDAMQTVMDAEESAKVSTFKSSHLQILVFIGFVSTTFLLASTTQWLLERLRIPLPSSVALFLLGICISAIVDTAKRYNYTDNIFVQGVSWVETMDHTVVFFALLPMCLYESAASMPFHAFKHVSISAFLLAGPGVALNAFFIGLFFKYCVSGVFTWTGSMLVGSILSATDPVAVISALKDLGAPDKLAVLLEGESLLNDGSAVVLFELFFDIMLGKDKTFKDVVVDFCRLGFIGPGVGFLVGLLLYAWFSSVRTYFEIQISVIVGSIYFLSVAAEYYLHSSSVLTVVTFGLTISAFAKASFAPCKKNIHQNFFAIMACLATQALFLVSGLLAAKYLQSAHLTFRMFTNVFLLFVIGNLSRLFVICLLSPILRSAGYGMTLKESIVLFWGGIRGGVALALAIVVDGCEQLPMAFREQSTFYIAGFTVLTLLFNGTTFKKLFSSINVYDVSPARIKFLKRSLASIEDLFVQEASKFLDVWFVNEKIYRALTQTSIVPDMRQGFLNQNGKFEMPTGDPNVFLPSCYLSFIGTAYDTDSANETNSLLAMAAQQHSHRSLTPDLLNESTQNRKTQFDAHKSKKTSRFIVENYTHKNDKFNGSEKTVKSPRQDLVADILDVIFNSDKQAYNDMHMEHAITGEALLFLEDAADSAIDAIAGMPRTSPFLVQWRHIQNGICPSWVYNTKFNRIYLVRRMTFSQFSRDVESLIAYITVHNDLCSDANSSEDPQFNIQRFIGTSKMEEIRQCVQSAKNLLNVLLSENIWMGYNAIAKIQAQMLLHMKREFLLTVKKSDIVLGEDIMKVMAHLDEQRLKVQSYVPPYAPPKRLTSLQDEKKLKI